MKRYPEMDVSELKVLVVDDHPVEREHVRRLLRKAGIAQPRLHPSPRAAVDCCCRDAADLVICDIMMPGGGGSELVLLLRERFLNGQLARLPVLAWLSSVDSVMLFSHMRMAQEAGFDCVKVMCKPLRLPECQDTLSETVAILHAGGLPRAARPEAPIDADTVRAALLHSDEFEPWFQPQLSLDDGRCQGAEALIRWVRPGVGVLPPSRFISLISELGLEETLFFRVVEQVAAMQHRLLAGGIQLPISVNASATVLSDPQLPQRLERCWREAGLAPALLKVELTENVHIEHSVELMVVLNRLRACGFGLAIDDYGVGISTLRILADIPFTELKLDRSFVQNMQSSDVCRELVRSAIELGQRLGMTVVAEGVENEAQQSMLQAIGCVVGQGYGLYRPMRGEELLDLLQSNAALTRVADRQEAKGRG
ncbi:EAL domain-containing protein [Chromobacterium sp. ASV23]|uniref:EAL domain-containing response regulator n=1 Tax=Chromobacterium sp. ASV23 TaxID=2795110 RepID=UPI0018ED15EE|nr:EAL domain-containing response regulator [Chromobacterium sp. ASV23]